MIINPQVNKNKVISVFMVVAVSWIASYLIRFEVLPEAQQGLFNQFLILLPFLALITSRVFFSYKLFYKNMSQDTFHRVLTTVRANVTACVLFVVILYFSAPEKFSRLVLLFYFIISTILFLILDRIMSSQKEMIPENILVISEQENEVLNHFNKLGQVTRISPQSFDLKSIHDKRISLVVLSQSPKSQDILAQLKNELVQIIYFPSFEKSYLGSQLFEMDGFPALQLNVPVHRQFDLMIKRAFDFTSVLIGLILISPLLFLLAILVKLTSPGPIFYFQERMGLDGKVFKMWKFRSMKVSAENKPGWTVENDPRRTPFGSFIRATSLDEMPQLWNVLVGDMSLVGPRPEQPYFVDKFKQEIPTYMLRHRMKAGITGWAQINGWRGNTSIEKRVECDIYYIKNWSLFLDIKIIFLTFWRGFINKNAY